MSVSAPNPRSTPARQQLADSLRRLRAERNWSQEELAARCELDRSFVAHVERGARNISLDNVEKLANAFGVGIADLFLRRDPKGEAGTIRA
ncbi:helix-turn-helix transcriptional regulator [Paraburkholderia phymatum]|uniref:Transcriptional regulator, XRE family n=1 Tax=Paraburkholderia phymatum (strain DSM 17167 / CIP 108236 / LMG 21445 / STM815) TaxID=391038 RepID=B2JC81_PARP8|nr:helix-turn-helix transcriptional regulator [Paraburkholderia phymatum]ACC69445.1 transcriptional regulator, XRE family [Paraburkholderia phymatum STM815]